MKKLYANISYSIFLNFLDFLTLTCYKETNDVSLEQMMSAFFHFQHTLYRLFNNCIKLYWYQISSSWNMKGRSNWPPLPGKTTLKKPSLIRVNTNLSLFSSSWNVDVSSWYVTLRTLSCIEFILLLRDERSTVKHPN